MTSSSLHVPIDLPLSATAGALAGAASTAPQTCLHCGASISPDRSDRYCCLGCRLVREVIEREHLDRYYDLRGSRGQPVQLPFKPRDHRWLEPLLQRLRSASGPERIELDVQGLHCAACVWLIERCFERTSGGVSVLVNPALGKMSLVAQPTFALGELVDRLESFGYVVGPSMKAPLAKSSDLSLRMGICIALAMNAMLFAFAIYAGLDAGRLHRLFASLEFGLAALSVAIGGPVFFRRAIQGLLTGLLHLDLPISLGIVLAFGSSAVAFFGMTAPRTYFDTLSVFIALMLVGRFLQERIVEKNRRLVLEADGAEGLLTRRLRDGTPSTIACKEVCAGDLLLLAPHDLLPVDGVLESEAACFALDWINGESDEHPYVRGAEVPAGAFAAGDRAVIVRSIQDFSASPLVELLRRPADDGEAATSFWRAFARWYVACVLLVAALSFVIAFLRAHDFASAISVVTAVLIVTCPCAFGIATPIAYELVLVELRRRGLFVRRTSFLDRAAAVRRVVFDKTGTLTTGTLVLADRAPFAGLSEEQLSVLYQLSARSAHPKSVALLNALLAEGQSPRLDPECKVRELAGRGLSLRDRGSPGATVASEAPSDAMPEAREWRLGEPGWVSGARATGDGGADLAFGVDGRVLRVFATREELRADAAREVRALEQDGFEVFVLSGDGSDRVAAVAESCGIAAARTFAARSAEAKREVMAELDHHDTLFVGDGINDSLAISRAFCGGTPAIDRPFMAAKSDFYFVTPGLAPIRAALAASRALRRTVRLNLAVAVVYNLVTISLAIAGRMSPLLCAIVMPLSSVSTIAATTLSLSRRSRWK